MANLNERINLNVGGTKYSTTLKTLQAYPNSKLAELFSTTNSTSLYNTYKDELHEFFLGREGSQFKYTLHFLRDKDPKQYLEKVR